MEALQTHRRKDSSRKAAARKSHGELRFEDCESRPSSLSESCLPHRPHRYSQSLRPFPLQARRRLRRVFSISYRRSCVPTRAHRRIDRSAFPRIRAAVRAPSSPRHRSGKPIHRYMLSRCTHSRRHPPTLRRHRESRLHRPHREILENPQTQPRAQKLQTPRSRRARKACRPRTRARSPSGDPTASRTLRRGTRRITIRHRLPRSRAESLSVEHGRLETLRL